MKSEIKIFDSKTIEQLKKHILGFSSKEVTTEYLIDEETGQLKVSKQKVQEKILPPNIDLLKILCQQIERPKEVYETLSDEELEKEKQRLLKQLKEEEIDSRKKKNSIKCDASGCNDKAIYTIVNKKFVFDGNVYLCDKCFNELYTEMGKFVVPKNLKSIYKKGGLNE